MPPIVQTARTAELRRLSLLVALAANVCESTARKAILRGPDSIREYAKRERLRSAIEYYKAWHLSEPGSDDQ